MFGYIIPNYDELKVKEFKHYHEFYCGLCQSLKKYAGLRGQISLTYDMTFLGLLLSSLYEDEPADMSECRCVAHPKKKHRYVISEYIDYAADMNVLMTYYKCMDDLNYEKKFLKVVYGKLLKKKEKSIALRYEEKTNIILENLASLYMAEKAQSQDLDEVSGYFGKICEAIFEYKNDEWSEILKKIGFYLGKFIYLLDAYEDMNEDEKKDCYNPLIRLKEQKREKFDDYMHDIFVMMMSKAGRAYNRLPIVENSGILDNIIYSGVWQKYNRILSAADKDNLKTDNPDWRKI